jgi:hypothetical protein
MNSDRVIFAATLILAMLLQVSSAAAEVLTRCGASSGVTFYFEGGVIGADKAGWQKDAIPGSFELVANADYSEADIIYDNRPPIGPSSYRAEGATVTVLPGGAPGSLLLLAITPDRVDHYLFKFDKQGKGLVVWGTAGTSVLSQKDSLMTAACHAPL